MHKNGGNLIPQTTQLYGYLQTINYGEAFDESKSVRHEHIRYTVNGNSIRTLLICINKPNEK